MITLQPSQCSSTMISQDTSCYIVYITEYRTDIGSLNCKNSWNHVYIQLTVVQFVDFKGY